MGQVIPDAWQVPAKFRARVGQRAGRQRAMFEEGHLLLILHDIPGENGLERTAKLFWRNNSSQWRTTGSSSDGLPALKRHIEAFRNTIATLDTAAEKGQSAVEFYKILMQAQPIARTVRHLHKTLQEARELVPDDKELISIRDAAGDIERAAELVISDATVALEFVSAKKAEEQAESAKHAAEAQHRLNTLAAMFFPITAIGSIMGINLKSGLESQPPWLFWVLVALALVVGFFVRGSVQKKP